MLRRGLRLTLLTVFLAAMAATAYLFWMAEGEGRRTESAARMLDEAARSAILSVTELRAAQEAYVATGQGADFWFARSNALQNELKGKIVALRTSVSASRAVSALEGALGLLQDFEQMDFRAREHARSRQVVAASDLIFADGLELTRKLADAIEQGRAAGVEALDLESAALERRELFSLGAAAAAATLIVLLLVPVREPVPESPPELARAIDARPAVSPDVQMEIAESLAPAPSPAPPVPVLPPVVETREAPAVQVPDSPQVDLQGVARLCGDLARMSDTRALPGMLERAATLLDATGLVLWIADPDGRELAPIATHGYSPQLVTRLGTIPRAAENATAAAFRTALLQTVKTDSVSNGAIAAPLLTPGGCVGVIAAELRNEGERHEAVLAAAGIFAAQLATLVGPPSSRAAMKADAAG